MAEPVHTSGQRPTLEVVAARAGVSRATVSRVLNGSSRVSPEVHKAVMAAVEELGYSPNRAARSLVTRRSDSIALVVAEVETKIFAEPYFGRTTRGVTTELAETDLQLVLAISYTSEQRRRFADYAANRHVDGVLLISIHEDDPLPRRLEQAGVPLVVVGRPGRSGPACYVDADNVGGARRAVAHLVGRGRRRIGTVTGPQDMSPGLDRLEGYYQALRDAGRRPVKSLVAIGDFGEESGERGALRLIEAQPKLDAVFAASDPMAIGAMRALRAAGRRIPDDVAVVGFDDNPVAGHTDPPLTTVRQPIEEMGRRATRMLLSQIAGEPLTEKQVVLATDLVVRGSS